MNTYNENLRSNVVASLRNRELDLKKIGSELKTANEELFQAGAAKIKATEEFAKAKEKFNDKEDLKTKAVMVTNSTANISTSSAEANQTRETSVSTTAIAAANVQVASNAVVELASDMGGIFSILQAANYGTQVFQLGEKAYNLINKTAYQAKLASEMGMNASERTALISSGKVAELATAIKASSDVLLQNVDAQYKELGENVDQKSGVLAAATNREKLAKGKKDDTEAAQLAAKYSYKDTNDQLNIGLQTQNLKEDSFEVTFQQLKVPFKDEEVKDNPEKNIYHYPAERYYIFIVKDAEKSIFSLDKAEQILANYTSGKKPFYGPIPQKQGTMFGDITKKVMTTKTCTSDGGDIELGKDYVVFVFAEYYSQYKQRLNNFSNYLSAPSKTFKLTQLLKAPKSWLIWYLKKGSWTANQDEVRFFFENPQPPAGVQYRCMFLPLEISTNKKTIPVYDALKVSGFSDWGLVEELNYPFTTETAKEYLSGCKDDLKAYLKPNAGDKKGQLDKEKKSGLEQQETYLKRSIQKVEVNKLKEELDQLNSDIYEEIDQSIIQELRSKKTSLESKIQDKMKGWDQRDAIHPKLNYFFDLEVALNICGGNFVISSPKAGELGWFAPVTQSTTDIFGSRLIVGNQYIPLILCVPDSQEKNPSKFMPSMSNQQTTAAFKYERGK